MENQFVVTDPDTGQQVRKNSDTHFTVIEDGVTYEIDLARWSDEQLEPIVRGFFDSLEHLRAEGGAAANQWIAEILAEAGFRHPPRANAA